MEVLMGFMCALLATAAEHQTDNWASTMGRQRLSRGYS